MAIVERDIKSFKDDLTTQISTSTLPYVHFFNVSKLEFILVSSVQV